MKATNKIELKIENQDKCILLIEPDCSLGNLYDFACVMKNFFIEKMKEQQDLDAAKKQAESQNVVSES